MPRPQHIDAGGGGDEHDRSRSGDDRLRGGRGRARRERGGGAYQHQRVAGERGSPVPGAHEYEPLVVVLAVRLPDALAADEAPKEGQRRVADEGRKDEQWKPERPDVVTPAREAE